MKPVFAMLRIAALNALVMAMPILAIAGDFDHDHSPATLVRIVRANTAQFVNVNNLQGTGYAPLFGCVSGPDHGAMGIHYLNLGLVGDGMLGVWSGLSTSWTRLPGLQPTTVLRHS